MNSDSKIDFCKLCQKHKKDWPVDESYPWHVWFEHAPMDECWCGSHVDSPYDFMVHIKKHGGIEQHMIECALGYRCAEKTADLPGI